jgi:hypothetical protein
LRVKHHRTGVEEIQLGKLSITEKVEYLRIALFLENRITRVNHLFNPSSHRSQCEPTVPIKRKGFDYRDSLSGEYYWMA